MGTLSVVLVVVGVSIYLVGCLIPSHMRLKISVECRDCAQSSSGRCWRHQNITDTHGVSTSMHITDVGGFVTAKKEP
jgi:hypothetical protein